MRGCKRKQPNETSEGDPIHGRVSFSQRLFSDDHGSFGKHEKGKDSNVDDFHNDCFGYENSIAAKEIDSVLATA